MKKNEKENSEFFVWDPASALEQVEANKLRYSSGFLRSDPIAWFEGFQAHWLPLFHSLSMNVEIVSFEMAFDFPENLNRIVPIEIEGEHAIIGMDEDSQDIITSAVVS